MAADIHEVRSYRECIRQDLRSIERLRRVPHKTPAEQCWWVLANIEWLERDTLNLRRALNMPKQEKKQQEWRGFVDVKLTGDEKAAFAAWDVDGEDLWVALADVLVAGHKLSLTYNKQNDQYVASFTGQQEKGNNSGLTLSAYAKDWVDAARVLMFKHVVLLDGDWGRAAERAADDIG